MVYYHEAECHAEKKLVHCLQCQGHSMGFCNQTITISTVSSKLPVHLQSNLVLIIQHHKLECSVEKLNSAFKVKVAAKVQNISECLSG